MEQFMHQIAGTLNEIREQKIEMYNAVAWLCKKCQQWTIRKRETCLMPNCTGTVFFRIGLKLHG